MAKTPNNFPREGEHNPVTRDTLATLESGRAVPNKALDYTIGGTTETAVHTAVEAERNYAMTSGHKRLDAASDKMQTDHVFAANKGRAKAQFNTPIDPPKAYVDMQREKAKTAPPRPPTRDR